MARRTIRPAWGLAAAIVLGLMWLFWIHPTGDQVARTLRHDLPVGTNKAVVLRYLKDRGYRPAEYLADKGSSDYHDPSYVEYQADSMISAGVPNQAGGFLGWVHVTFAFDRHGHLLRFETEQVSNGL